MPNCPHCGAMKSTINPYDLNDVARAHRSGYTVTQRRQVMAKVMSPKAPERETRGFEVALQYYAKRPLLSRAGILQSAELLRQHFTESQGYEFANGFVDGATIAAQTRRVDTNVEAY